LYLFLIHGRNSGYKDVMSFSALPTLRWPIVHYWTFLERWFATSNRPTSEEIARTMGVSGQGCSAARRLGQVLLTAEAVCAERTQEKRKLSGLLEVDGTSIRKFVLPGTATLRYLQYFGALQRGKRCINLYRLQDADSKAFGKPPPESFGRISKTQFVRQVLQTTASSGRTCLISDGAPAYVKLCPRMKVLHRACCQPPFTREEPTLHGNFARHHCLLLLSLGRQEDLILRWICTSVLGNGVGKTALVLERTCARKQRKSSCKTLLDILGRRRKKPATEIALALWRRAN
jgi:hypothetical protein